MSRKERIGAAFSAAAASYDDAARAQGWAADHLCTMLAALNIAPAPRVLELGCGTGLLTRRLRPMLGGDWLVTDLSPTMVAAAQARLGPGATFLVMDGENPPAGLGPFDLIVSNLAAQWFADLPGAVARLAGLLAPGGHLVLSSLGADTFREWRAAHAALGLACGIPPYPDAAGLATQLGSGTRVEQHHLVLDYADGRAFAAELRALGATIPAPGHRPLAPGALRRVFAQLGRPVSITHHLLFIVVTKD